MQEGQKVVVLGGVSVYERDGKYQLYAKEIILDGVGDLYERFEALKRELEETGMFAPQYKRPIPKYAKTVGIVTAPTGAAVRDIIHVAGRRNPYVQLVLYPALVQGEGAVESIVRGIRALEEYKVDVMIVGRGGGSIEDLWAFNEEAVARAIFDCGVPVISAVGHETDVLISDFVADLRAPTPSAAAELAVGEYAALEGRLLEGRMRIKRQMQARVRECRQRLDQLSLRLRHKSPQQRLNENRQRSADLETALRRQMGHAVEARRHRMAIYIEKMRGLSPLLKLNQGYSYMEDASGRQIRSVGQVAAGDEVRVFVKDGCVTADVKKVQKDNG
jgi:exodeoxyribonuclease VII large subunit